MIASFCLFVELVYFTVARFCLTYLIFFSHFLILILILIKR